MKQRTLFDGMRLTLEQAVEQSVDSLNQYGARYRHWALAYSGGKDSSHAIMSDEQREWLKAQPGGISATLRRLVDEAMQNESPSK